MSGIARAASRRAILGGPLASVRSRPACPRSLTRVQLPVVGTVCDAVSSAAGSVASAAGDYVMRGVTEWVTDAAVWVTGKVGDLVDATTSPDLRPRPGSRASTERCSRSPVRWRS